jgi:N-acetylglucosamine-6-sulfatase
LAIRTERWKFVATPGIWDKDALYDLQTDPTESYNLIGVPAFQERAMSLQSQLFQELGESGGLQIPIMPPRGEILDARKLGR